MEFVQIVEDMEALERKVRQDTGSMTTILIMEDLEEEYH